VALSLRQPCKVFFTRRELADFVYVWIEGFELADEVGELGGGSGVNISVQGQNVQFKPFTKEKLTTYQTV